MKRKVWAVLTALALGICSSNLHVMAEGNSESAAMTEQQMAYTLPFSVEKDDVNINFKLAGKWNGGYQCEIVLTNVGTEKLAD